MKHNPYRYFMLVMIWAMTFGIAMLVPINRRDPFLAACLVITAIIVATTEEPRP